MPKQEIRKQQGMALILVLSLVAWISSWAVNAAYEDDISLRQAENMQASAKAWMATESLLDLSKRLLLEDLKNDTPNVDHLQEMWAQPAPPFPVDDGVVAGEIRDANRYYNLNDLVSPQGLVQVQEVSFAKRLFANIGLDADLVDALVDWMDKDNKPLPPAGKENASYSESKYSVKNAPLDRIEEVLLVHGFDRQALQSLREVATVFPVSTQIIAATAANVAVVTKININTASKEVLMSLSQTQAVTDVDAIMTQREELPFLSVAAFTSSYPWAVALQNHLSVQSDVFIIHARARFGRVQWGERYMLTRTTNNKRVTLNNRRQLGWTE
ncbi:MAG: type II secretion system minor pseudopilin GspK [Mariprofundales bacterium]